MANTGKDKKLATFNIDGEIWQAFQAKARENGSSASGLLKQWINVYLDGVEVPIKSEIAVSNSTYIDSGNDIGTELEIKFDAKLEKLREELLGELSA